MRALRLLGLEVGMGTCACPPKQSALGDCFALATSADVIDLVTGAKLLGAALFRKEEFFLQQVSLPLNQKCEQQQELSQMLFRGDKKVTTQRSLNASFLQEAMQRAFEEVLDIRLREAKASPEEEAKTLFLQEERYLNRDWVRKGVSPLK